MIRQRVLNIKVQGMMRMNTDSEWKEEEGIRFQVRENRTALVCGVLAVLFAVFILVMRLLHPSGRGGGVLLYVPLLCMLAGGAACWVLYFNRKLIVEEMNICYVNFFGKRKQFKLDEIGFCKIGVGGNRSGLVMYDLLGEKLCKLEIDMRGIAEFYQYLEDNRIEVEWKKERMDRQFAFLIDALHKETAICEEEICRCTEKFYEEAVQIFREWEEHNRRFDVQWEIGFAQYLAEDLERKCHLRERTSSVKEPMETIPDYYQCFLEAYLKQEDEYVVDSHGEEVHIVLPYLGKSRSYQIGEGMRIRKTDEQSMTEWLNMRLEVLTGELPRHRYHTEAFTLGHELCTVAGVASRHADKLSEG